MVQLRKLMEKHHIDKVDVGWSRYCCPFTDHQRTDGVGLVGEVSIAGTESGHFLIMQAIRRLMEKFSIDKINVSWSRYSDPFEGPTPEITEG